MSSHDERNKIWIEWAVRNPELAKKHHPGLIELIEEVIHETPDYVTANIIQSLPEDINSKIRELDSNLSSTQSKKTKEYIDLIDFVLFQFKPKTEVEIEAIKTVKDELLEAKNYLQTQNIQAETEYNLSHINWLKSDESLKQLIEALKEHNLIKSRETETTINYHFKPHRKQNSKPEPIIWLETIALLAYMIESLDQHYIKPENIWSDTAPHFSKNGKTPQNLRQTANRFKQNKSRKPKNHEIIDNIIQSLSE